MLTEMVGWAHKIEEEVKSTQSEIEENVQGPNSVEKDIGTQNNNLDPKEEINIQPEQNEETRIEKNKERLRNLQDNFKHYNLGVPEGEEEEQEIENLFEQITKENFPNVARK